MKKWLSLLIIFTTCFATENWMLVIHSQTASISDDQLTLGRENQLVAALSLEEGKQTRVFPIDKLGSEWEMLFNDSPVNATVYFKDSQGKFAESVVVLQPPQVKSSKLTFQIIELGKPIKGELGETVVFMKTEMVAHPQRNSGSRT